MRKSIFAIVIALAFGQSFATQIGNNSAGATGGNATGGSVIGSGNSANTNTQGQQQGQAQGQMQGQAAIGVGIGGNSAANSNSNSGASSNSGGNTLTGGAQTSTQANSVTVNGDTYQAQERNPVNTAYAPSIAPTALCALGVSGGAQGVSFGLSFGKSYTDENCVLLEQVRATATVLGDRATAAEMMCAMPAYKEARARSGKPCGTPAPAPAAKPAVSASAPSPSASGYTGNDPFVIKRLTR